MPNRWLSPCTSAWLSYCHLSTLIWKTCTTFGARFHRVMPRLLWVIAKFSKVASFILTFELCMTVGQQHGSIAAVSGPRWARRRSHTISRQTPSCVVHVYGWFRTFSLLLRNASITYRKHLWLSSDVAPSVCVLKYLLLVWALTPVLHHWFRYTVLRQFVFLPWEYEKPPINTRGTNVESVHGRDLLLRGAEVHTTRERRQEIPWLHKRPNRFLYCHQKRNNFNKCVCSLLVTCQVHASCL